MPTTIAWKLNVEIQSGPNIIVTNVVQADAYDRIEVKVPDSTAAPTATTVDVQPGAAGKVKLLLIRSSKYGNNLKYKVHDNTTAERVLNDAVFLVGAGSLDLLEDAAAPLDKLLITNTTGQDVVLEIIVGRTAI
ncbi:MAG: hypothetical protein HY268_01640 [Deltaproteobacteria bacterium]|nr:hypothetical protein [Deltaproteobacteria bacterium]